MSSQQQTLSRRLLRAATTITAAVLAAGLGTAAASATPTSGDPVHILQRVESSSNPQSALDKLSASERALIDQEFATSKTVVTEVVDDAMTPYSYTGCYRRTQQAAKVGGVTHKIMFQVVQTTKVCVTRGKVTKVTMPQKYQTTSYPLWRNGGLTSSTRNKGYEGRGVARGTFIFGVNGIDVKRATICSQLRMNANGYSVIGNSKCAV